MRFSNLDKALYKFYHNPMELILASGSPRRKMFFEQLGLKFTTMVTGVEEVILNTPVETCLYNAIQKVKWVANNIKIDNNSIIVGFDTLVYINEKILGKPESKESSKGMLDELSGAWHEVYTGIALWEKEEIIYDFEMTRVKFHSLTETQINLYVDSGETLDKAGSYGIQDKNMSFIDRIEGDFTNVVGLPLSATRNLLHKAGIII